MPASFSRARRQRAEKRARATRNHAAPDVTLRPESDARGGPTDNSWRRSASRNSKINIKIHLDEVKIENGNVQ
jgi:hypothetical protein